MQFSEKPKRKVRINITSLIDVLFLLLIFFMVSSTFLEQPGMKLDLPEAKSFEVESQEELVLHISPDGSLFLGEEPTTTDSLLSFLEKEVEGGEQRPLILKADQEVMHGRVVEIMDIAKQAGVRKLVVATRVKPGT